jgi:small subunit ribosomal protein S3
MSTITHFINEAIRNIEIDEFLEKKLDKAGFGGVEVVRTPLGTRVIIYATRPGLVIGRRGSNIVELTRLLEEKFKLQNPQIAVSEIEFPELNARVMASRIADALQRGIHFRRTGFWALNQIMKAGALGAEITVTGKLTSQRHRFEKYREGYIVRSGDPSIKSVLRAVASVQLKQGLIGINIKIIPPGAVFPDRVRITKGIEVEVGEGPQIEKSPSPVGEAEPDTVIMSEITPEQSESVSNKDIKEEA